MSKKLVEEWSKVSRCVLEANTIIESFKWRLDVVMDGRGTGLRD